MNTGFDPSRRVPTAPVIGRLALVFAWVMEVNALIVRVASGGARPSPVKLGIVTALTIAGTIYELTWRKRHKVYDQPSPILTNRQSWLVLALVVFYLALGGWLFVP